MLSGDVHLSEQQIRLARHDLASRGWAVLEGLAGEQLADVLVALTGALGMTPCKQRKQFVQRLIPLDERKAHPRSLSAQFGTGGFPFHVDTAHWTRPCRYVLMGAPVGDQTERPTELLDFTQLPLAADERQALSEGLFLVAAGRSSFYATAYANDRPFVRFDPGCMKPMDDQAMRAVTLLIPERWVDIAMKVYWARGTVLVLDNWRMLHRRAAAANEAGSRPLLRALAQ